MSLKLGEIAPDFTQDSTEGPIHFHEWARQQLGDPVLAPQGFHAGLHHGAGRGRETEEPNSTSGT